VRADPLPAHLGIVVPERRDLEQLGVASSLGGLREDHPCDLCRLRRQPQLAEVTEQEQPARR
jgi:hypothetical protein